MSTDPSPAVAATQEAERRAARNAAKLAALVRDRWGFDAPRVPFGTGAAMVVEGQAFILLDEPSGGTDHQPADAGAGSTLARLGRARHGLGAALAWARRHVAAEIHLIADHERGGRIARIAQEFRTPISVWSSQGRDLEAVPAADFESGDGPPDAPDLVATLEAQGLDVVVEGDRLSGEYRGLEVVRIVRALDNAEPILEVGVGRFDRELTAMMHADLPDASAVARAVEQLREIRRPGGPNHPLAQLVPERWLRSTLLSDPARIGCDELVAAPTPEPRDRLRTRGVAAAVGTRAGAPVVVVTTVGMDLEAVVLAAEARASIDPEATLLLALPERDVLPTTSALVADLRHPAEIAAVEGDWRS